MAYGRFFILTGMALLAAGPALSDNLTIGVVAPLTGPLAILGKQVVDGGSFAAAAHGNKAVVIEDACDPEAGPAIADKLIAANVTVATGFLCTESLEAALPKLAEAKIPVITLGVRSAVLMQDALKAGWPLFRLGPSQSAETERLADLIGTEWSAEPFALVDDGNIGNHDLIENLRAALEERGVKPVLNDTLHPGQDQQLTLVRHLSSAGVTRAFIAADRDDIAVVAKDLKEQGLAISVLAGASVDTTPGTVPLPSGVRALVMKNAAADPENADLIKAMRAKGFEPEGYVLPSAAAQDVADAALVAAETEGKAVSETLLGRAFDTPFGPVRFSEKHELTENPYDIMEWNGTAFAAASKP